MKKEPFLGVYNTTTMEMRHKVLREEKKTEETSDDDDIIIHQVTDKKTPIVTQSPEKPLPLTNPSTQDTTPQETTIQNTTEKKFCKTIPEENDDTLKSAFKSIKAYPNLNTKEFQTKLDSLTHKSCSDVYASAHISTQNAFF